MTAPAEFRIRYADGTTYDDHDGPWEQAPSEGVIVVAVIDRERTPLRGRWLLCSADYYVRPPGSLYPWATNELQPMLARVMGAGWTPPNPWPPMEQIRRYLQILIHPTTGLPMAAYVKHGATVDYEVWQTTMEDAWSDPELPAPLSPSRRADDVPDVPERLSRGAPQGPVTPPFTGGP